MLDSGRFRLAVVICAVEFSIACSPSPPAKIIPAQTLHLRDATNRQLADISLDFSNGRRSVEMLLYDLSGQGGGLTRWAIIYDHGRSPLDGTRPALVLTGPGFVSDSISIELLPVLAFTADHVGRGDITTRGRGARHDNLGR